MVTINITKNQEEEPRKFVVHREFICHHSPYFDAAFNGEFVEGQTQTLDLEDVRPYVFEVFINWIYTQTISSLRGGPLDIKWMMPLWLAGERFLVPDLQNQTLQLFEKERVRLSAITAPSAVQHIHNNSTEGCVLRKYIVAICDAVHHMLNKDTEYLKDFLVDLVNYRRSYIVQQWIAVHPDNMKLFLVEIEPV